ncbi:hypothetical protein LCGC14_0267590 [marine sediment metagenome]|uniref:Uncharacterized protein n=1 Tax=marine sediment metagenome TaxID=412755 RepID=A0A0F9X4V5_9ZZZZ
MAKNEKENKPKKEATVGIIDLDIGESYDMPASEFFDKLKEALTNRPQVDLTQMSIDEIQSVLDGQRGYLCLKLIDKKEPRQFATIFSSVTLTIEMPELMDILQHKSPLTIVKMGKYDIMDGYPKDVKKFPLKTYKSIDKLLEVWEVD